MTPSLGTARRVLVRLPNWLGDALMARPFLVALRRAAPAARITAVGPAPLLALLAADRTWDEAQPWPLPAAARLPWPERPDVAFVLPPSFSSAWFAFRAGARARIGYAGDARSLLLTHALARPERGERHLAREFLALLGEDAARAEAPAPAPPLAAGEQGEREAGALLDGLPGAGAPLAIVAPGAVYGPAKRWPVERFGEVARVLANAGHRVLACGGQPEVATCDSVVAASSGACVSVAGRTSLAAQLALCARAAVVVSNDSGMAHLAGAAGAPTVAIFGSTSSAWTAPLGAHVRVVQHPPVCAPCFRRTCAIGYGCLAAVSVREVCSAIDSLAGGRQAGGAA